MKVTLTTLGIDKRTGNIEFSYTHDSGNKPEWKKDNHEMIISKEDAKEIYDIYKLYLKEV